MEDPFAFDLDERVMVTRIIRNDGTYPGKNRGDILAFPGQTGVVIDRGFFLQDIPIYVVRLNAGITLGCLAKELASISDDADSLVEEGKYLSR